jgi:hypothetical protein
MAGLGVSARTRDRKPRPRSQAAAATPVSAVGVVDVAAYGRVQDAVEIGRVAGYIPPCAFEGHGTVGPRCIVVGVVSGERAPRVKTETVARGARVTTYPQRIAGPRRTNSEV